MLKHLIFNSFLFLFSLNMLFFFNNFNLFFNNIFIYFNVDFFSLLLLITTSITLFLSLIIIENKYFNKNKELFFIFFIFIFFIFGLVFSNNIFSFFLFYELLLIPSYVLVLKSSPNKRSKIISNYFLFWTQLGSFFVLLGLFNYYNLVFFNNFNTFNFFYLFSVQFLIFIGFGIKVPLWPFHFWLSKTHVEANTGFSIFLSGILVKAAIFGLYKFLYIFLLKNTWLFITIILISICDASFKMCIQNDLKKLVAFSTIQEMAFMSLLLFINTIKNNQILFIFVIFHTFISGLYFLIVDSIYKRFNTRIVYNVKGISNINTNLSCFILISNYLFMGLPFTIKFSIEVFILKILLNFNIIITLFIGFLINYLSMVFFFKIFTFINFGQNSKIISFDLNKKEFFLFFFFIFFIIILNII